MLYEINIGFLELAVVLTRKFRIDGRVIIIMIFHGNR